MSILGWYPFPYQGMYPSSYKSMYPSPYKGIYPSSYKGMYPSPNRGLFPRLLYSSIANIPLNPHSRSPAILYSCFIGGKRLRSALLSCTGELPAGLRGTARGLSGFSPRGMSHRFPRNPYFCGVSFRGLRGFKVFLPSFFAFSHAALRASYASRCLSK